MSDVDHVDVTSTEETVGSEIELSKCAYCGCQKDGVLIFHCVQCHCWVHASCLHSGPPSSLLGDNYFIFKCANCSGDNSESFKRMKLTWSQVITIALYNMAQTSLGKQGFFKWKEELCLFVDKNWEIFFGKNKKRSPQWNCSVGSVLSSGNPHRFLSGYGLFKETGWWRLVDPTKVPEYVPTSGVPSVTKSRYTRKSHFGSSSARSNSRKRHHASLVQQSNEVKAKQVSLKETGEEPLEASASLQTKLDENIKSITNTGSWEKSKLSQETYNRDNGVFVDSPLSGALAGSGSVPSSPSSSLSSDSKATLAKEVRVDPLLPLLAISDDEDDPEGGVLKDMKMREWDEETNESKGSSDKSDLLGIPRARTKQEKNASREGQTTYVAKATPSRPRIQMMSLYDEQKLLKKLLSLPSTDENLQARCLKRKLLLRQKKRELGLPVLNFDATVRQLRAKEKGVVLDQSLDCRGNDKTFFPSSDYRILDRFLSHERRLLNHQDEGRTFRQKLVGYDDTAERQPIVSPYTQRMLKPFIRRDFETKPPKLKLLEEIVSHHHRSDSSWRRTEPVSIDFCYVLPQHVPTVNAMCDHFFWPGVDLSESLQYPDFSVVALYKKMVIGFGFLVPDVSFNEAYISFLLVHPDWQRAGIGTFMLYHLMQTCMGKDVTLHVSASNTAMLLYQRFGFKPERFEADFYDKYMPPDTIECTHAFFMRLRR